MIGDGIADAWGQEAELVVIEVALVISESRSQGGFRAPVQKEKGIVEAVVIDTPPEGRFWCRPNRGRTSEGYHLDPAHLERRELLGSQAGDQSPLGVGDVYDDAVLLFLDRSDGDPEVFDQTVDFGGDPSQVFLLPGLRQVAEIAAGIVFVGHLGGIVIELDRFTPKIPRNNRCFLFHVSRVVPDSVHPGQSCSGCESEFRVSRSVHAKIPKNDNDRQQECHRRQASSECHYRTSRDSPSTFWIILEPHDGALYLSVVNLEVLNPSNINRLLNVKKDSILAAFGILISSLVQ